MGEKIDQEEREEAGSAKKCQTAEALLDACCESCLSFFGPIKIKFKTTTTASVTGIAIFV